MNCDSVMVEAEESLDGPGAGLVSWWHWGCLSSLLSLHSCLPLQTDTWKEEIDIRWSILYNTWERHSPPESQLKRKGGQDPAPDWQTSASSLLSSQSDRPLQTWREDQVLWDDQLSLRTDLLPEDAGGVLALPLATGALGWEEGESAQQEEESWEVGHLVAGSSVWMYRTQVHRTQVHCTVQSALYSNTQTGLTCRNQG